MPNPKSKRRRRLFVVVLLLLVLGGLTAAAFLRKREAILRVQVEKVARRDVTETVSANGRIQPVIQVKISAEVSGEIIELPVKEGQSVKKGDLLVRIKPDVYTAARRSSEASYLSALSGKTLSEANLRKAQQEFERNEELFRNNLISESIYIEYRTSLDVAKAQVESATHQVAMAKASLARADEELAKTEIYSPLSGTVSKLNSELGERVVGTAMMSGTEIMIVADLNQMEARVDIGEIDIPLIALGQIATLEVDAFRDREFKGTVSQIANSSKGIGATGGGGSSGQEGTKFEVRIRIQDQEAFRPGLSVTAEIQTRSRTNVLTVPVQSVTTRPPKPATNQVAQANAGTNSPADSSPTDTVESQATNTAAATTNSATGTNAVTAAKDKDRKPEDGPRHIEVVFLVEEGRARMVPVKRGISNDSHTEIVEGLTEGQQVVSGGYKAISKDLEDGKKVQVGGPESGAPADKKPE